jgi:glycosyltransferase involved in cell wall biosynthesis
MKISIVTEGPLGFNGEKYLFSEGGGYYLDRISAYFFDMTILTYALRKDSPYYNAVAHYAFKEKNIRIIEYPLAKNSSIWSKVLQLYRAVIFIYKQSKNTDLFYIFLPGYTGAVATIICRLKRKPYCVYLASDWPEEAATLNPIKSFFGALMLPFYRASVSYLQNCAVRGAKFSLVHGQPLVTKYENYRTPIIETVPRLHWPVFELNNRVDTCQAKTITILYVGYLIERKGVAYLLKAIQQLKNDGMDIKANIVGTGDLEADLKKLAIELDIDSVVNFMGYLPNDKKLMKVYKNADIFVCPSFSGEGFPRVLYEAMSQGVPIVSSDVCGISEKLVPEINALFSTPKDPESIKAQLLKIIKNKDLRQGLISNGYSFMAKLLGGEDGGNQFFKLVQRYIGTLK